VTDASYIDDVRRVQEMQAAGGAIPAGKGPLSGVLAVGSSGIVGGSYPGATDKPPTVERGGIIGGNLMPWTAFIDDQETVPDLVWPNSIRVYERMRQDGQIAGLLAGCVLPITRYRWQLDPNGARPEVVAKLAEQLALPVVGGDDKAPKPRSRDRFTFRQHLGTVLDYMLSFGHSFHEQVGTIDPDGMWSLRKLAPRPPRSITQIDVARDGGLIGIRQQGIGLDAATIPVQNLVAYVWQQEPGNWVGRSVLRPMYKHWLIKDRLIRVDAVKHERTGMGVPVGTMPQNGNHEAQVALARALAALKVGDTSEMTLPYGAKVELLGTSGSIPDTIASIRYHDELMARSILMMFMQLGTTASGSRALGDSQTDWFSMAQEGIAGQVADTFNQHVIEDWVDWNYGADETAPLVVFERVDDDSLPTHDLAELVRYGALTVDEDTENWLRDRHKMPELPAGSRTQTQVAAPGPTDGPEATAPAATAPAADAPATATASEHRHEHRSERQELGAFVSATNPRGHARFAGDTGEHAAILPDRKLRRAPNAMELAAKTDFRKLDTMWATATDALVADYRDKVLPGQLAKVKAQQSKAKTIAELATVEVEPAGAELFKTHLMATASEGIDTAYDEAKAQGVADVSKTAIDKLESVLAARAEGAAIIMAQALAEVAGRQAVTISNPAAIDGPGVATAVETHLSDLTDRFLVDNLGGAITGAQNDGRAAQMSDGPAGQIFASELLDGNTCDPCMEIDETEYSSMEEARGDYPAGGFIDCDGGPRCRGGLITVYEAEAGDAL